MVEPTPTPKVVIRDALPREKELFGALWLNMLCEIRDHYDGETIPSRRTMNYYNYLFDEYVTSSTKGVVLFADDGLGPCGCIMLGQAPGPKTMDSDLDPIAMGWGVAVWPQYRRQGVAKRLYQEGFRRLRVLGFGGCVGAVHIPNMPSRMLCDAIGFQVMQHIVTIDLRGGGPE